MKRTFLGMLLSVVLPAISVYAQGMRGGAERGVEGSGGGHGAAVAYHNIGYGHGAVAFHSVFGGRAGYTHAGGYRGGYHGHYYGRGYGRGHYYGRGYGGGLVIYGYGYGFPYGYPYYGSPYYGGPAYADYGDVTDDGYGDQPVYPYDTPVPDSAVDDSSETETYTAQDAQGYYQVGEQWGTGMKQYKLTMDQLVTYLKSYIVDASQAQQDAFRSGFIGSAIPNGAATYDKAMQQAVPPES